MIKKSTIFSLNGIPMLLLFWILSFSANVVAQETISSNGDYLKTSNGSISYTLGEPAIESLSNQEGKVNQGFQQSMLTVVSTTDLRNPDFAFNAFPNPANDYVILKTEKQLSDEMKCLITDLNGRTLSQTKISESETMLDFTQFQKGIYFIILSNAKSEFQKFKIIKQ